MASQTPISPAHDHCVADRIRGAGARRLECKSSIDLPAWASMESVWRRVQAGLLAAVLSVAPSYVIADSDVQLMRTLGVSAGSASNFYRAGAVKTREIDGALGYRFREVFYVGANLSLGKQSFHDGEYYRVGVGYEVSIHLPLEGGANLFAAFRRMDYEADGDAPGAVQCAGCPNQSVGFDNQANFVGVGLSQDGWFARMDKRIRSGHGAATWTMIEPVSGARLTRPDDLVVPEPDYVLALGVRF